MDTQEITTSRKKLLEWKQQHIEDIIERSNDDMISWIKDITKKKCQLPTVPHLSGGSNRNYGQFYSDPESGDLYIPVGNFLHSNMLRDVDFTICYKPKNYSYARFWEIVEDSAAEVYKINGKLGYWTPSEEGMLQVYNNGIIFKTRTNC